MKELEEKKNKQLIMSFWVLIISTVVFYLGIVFLAAYTLGEGTLFGVVVFAATVVLVIVAFFSLKIEIGAGYSECENCHHRYIPTYKQALLAPHVHTTRYMKCPKCGKKSWSRKVMTKED